MADSKLAINAIFQVTKSEHMPENVGGCSKVQKKHTPEPLRDTVPNEGSVLQPKYSTGRIIPNLDF